jgi:hypothetical protein
MNLGWRHDCFLLSSTIFLVRSGGEQKEGDKQSVISDFRFDHLV